MSDDSPKSAIEIMMERLRKQDADAGVTTTPLTDAQKASIAEVRSIYDAKIAEQQILQDSAMRRMFGADPAERDEIDRQFRREKERLASERDNKIEKIRRGES
jgi:hypothetical protein